MTELAPDRIDAATFAHWLDDGAELAVLDIRAAADVSYYGSPLFGKNLPAATLLDEIARYVPRKVIRTVLVDGGDSEAERLARALRAIGWENLVALAGGFPAWLDSGFADRSFDIPGKDFALAVRDERGTPVTTVQELADMRARGEDVIVIDTRTVPEYSRDHVPGAVNIPAAELLLRLPAVVASAETEIVVSCAGLPRAILGAQTLIDAGVDNRVSYLEDGTAAWRRAGWPLETGPTRVFDRNDDSGRAFASKHLVNLASASRFREIDLAIAREWAADPDRTTYLLDVRTPEEFADGHLGGTLSSEGGQLLGLSSRTIATRGARVVLVDDEDAIRATTVAHWLSRRDFEIAILRHPFGRGEQAVTEPEAALA